MSRAQEILDVVVNDAQLYAWATAPMRAKHTTPFIRYSDLVRRVQERYLSMGWEPFALQDMAAAIVLLHERFSEKD